MGRRDGRIHRRAKGLIQKDRHRIMSRTHSEGLEAGAWKIIAVAILGPFMSQMDSTVVNVSLSFIKQELRSTIASTQWVVSGYLLALAPHAAAQRVAGGPPRRKAALFDLLFLIHTGFSPVRRGHYPQEILLRLLIFNNMERWEYAVLLGKGAVRQYPQFGPLYLATAHAISRFEGAVAARTMLLAGEDALKDETAFHFMLACYDSQLGNLDLAKTELARAFEIDEELRLQALQDSDLKPLWESLGES
jgi:tetratricopeptide (TPR) repeat protein